jgi:2,5-furandicarboxylate decarboxylase 1
MFTVFIQMTARWDGQARAVLQAALSSPYLHPKIAIAVDEDVDIYDPREVFWAISTRLNPEKAVAILTNERIHPLDISVPNVDKSEVTVMRVGGKLAIDATKPPLWRKKEREEYTRVKPKGFDDPGLQELLRRLGAMAR